MKRITHVLFLVITLAIASLPFNGCKKIYQNKLVGKWKMETMLLNSPYNPVYWKFNEDGTMEVANDFNCTLGSDTVKGNYRVYFKNVVSPYIEIDEPRGLDGRWHIEKLNKKVLVLNRKAFVSKDSVGAAYLRREFTKE